MTDAPRLWPAVLVLVAGVAFALSAALAFGSLPADSLGPYLTLDATTRLFLVLVDTMFLGIAGQAWSLIPHDRPGSAARFVGLATVFLVAVNVSVAAHHFLVGWIGLELSTVAVAPLIVQGSDGWRASWRYFLFSSVGLGLALLGYACLARSLGDHGWGDLFMGAPRDLGGGAPWRTLGLALLVIGYGTKLGLAPMYSWLPETYDAAPPVVTSLLAAVQFNVALVGLVRIVQVFRPGEEALFSTLLVGMGLASMAIATGSLIAATHLRRLVAYASIVHGGVIAIGLGVGGDAAYGVLLYAVSNAFIKAMLFMTAGRIEAEYGTRETARIRGVLKGLPYSGLFLMAGTFALLGFPPFGSFVGELLILSGLVRSGYLMTFATLGFLVSVSFIATGRTVFPMIWGSPEPGAGDPPSLHPQTFWASAPKLVFLVILVVLGLRLPGPVSVLFREVAMSLGER